MTGRIFRRAGRSFAPWKNGGGETAEILCHPVGAGMDDFDWRISTARVEASGPFSTFPGVDRVLMVLDGGRIDLVFGDGTMIAADPGSGPHRFPGEAPCMAHLKGDGVLNLNLMVRRPLRGSVHLPGQAVPSEALLICALFATEDLPGAGLLRHDLVLLDDAPRTIPGGALGLTVHTG